MSIIVSVLDRRLTKGIYMNIISQTGLAEVAGLTGQADWLDWLDRLIDCTGWTGWTGLTGLAGLAGLVWLVWLTGLQGWQGRQGWQGWQGWEDWQGWLTITYIWQIWNYHPTDWPTGPLTHGTNCKEMLSHLKRFIFIILNALSVANVVTFLWIAERFFLHILHQLGNAAIALCSREKLLFPQKQFKVRALTNL